MATTLAGRDADRQYPEQPGERQYQAVARPGRNTGDVSELGKTLHAWRDRVTPAEAGLPANGVRRAPGLRREELALLAGLSVDYVVRLEQGRSSSPSPQVLTSLARALRLDDAERDHLFVLAGQAPPAPGRISTYIPPGVQRLVDQLEGAPLSVADASWTMISWNSLWAAMLGDPSGLRGRERNIVWRRFAGDDDLPDGYGRVRQTDEQAERFKIAMITDLRAAVTRYPKDTELHSLVADLRAISTEFATAWDDHQIAFHGSDHKTIEHPDLGPIVLDCDVLTVPGSDLRIVVYTAPPNSEAAEKLKLLAVIGLQSLA
ncbi:helix-turn-helix transcriptional regulator [Kribbella italica]|uniref:Transcriptional regulator with XRE-family HTH domain n=1 Tax=Kribbella italica TaxID=1540520 RepID=A0A7W9JAJ9_9ACTN|nr:helix-turn-helix transcriptional regulator [Kribbella italica]MBB5838641.1 transcriptional regulator with XRE-family HTH domain [Kribbella italica]